MRLSSVGQVDSWLLCAHRHSRVVTGGDIQIHRRNFTCSRLATPTVEKHARVILQLPAAHALTGCDTVAQLWGGGKATCKRIMETGRPLDKLGDATADIGDVTSQATAFVAVCAMGAKNAGTCQMFAKTYGRERCQNLR